MSEGLRRLVAILMFSLVVLLIVTAIITLAVIRGSASPVTDPKKFGVLDRSIANEVPR